MPRMAIESGASTETLRTQLQVTAQMRLDAVSDQSWSAAANLMRHETELRCIIEAREMEPGAILGDQTEGSLVEKAAIAMLAMPAPMREAVYERVAVLEGGA